jgi:hemerythrin-like domain-containing protein
MMEDRPLKKSQKRQLIQALDAKNDLVRSYRDLAHNLQKEVDELRDLNRELRATVADLQESYSDKPTRHLDRHRSVARSDVLREAVRRGLVELEKTLPTNEGVKP